MQDAPICAHGTQSASIHASSQGRFAQRRPPALQVANIISSDNEAAHLSMSPQYPSAVALRQGSINNNSDNSGARGSGDHSIMQGPLPDTTEAHKVVGSKLAAHRNSVASAQFIPPNNANGGVHDVRHARNCNLFIRNLAKHVDLDRLNAIFSSFGTILSSAVMRDIHTGHSLGTAFVRYETHEQACAAMLAMGSSDVDGEVIFIQWAKKSEGAPVGEARKKIMKLFLRNVPLDCSIELLTTLFSQYGPVSGITVHRDTVPTSDNSIERHIAFVIFEAEGAAERAAKAVHNTCPFPSCEGIPLMVKLAEDNYHKGGKYSVAYSNNNGSRRGGNSTQQFNHPPQPRNMAAPAAAATTSVATVPVTAPAPRGAVSNFLSNFLSNSIARSPHHNSFDKGISVSYPQPAAFQSVHTRVIPAPPSASVSRSSASYYEDSLGLSHSQLSHSHPQQPQRPASTARMTSPLYISPAPGEMMMPIFPSNEDITANERSFTYEGYGLLTPRTDEYVMMRPMREPPIPNMMAIPRSMSGYNTLLRPQQEQQQVATTSSQHFASSTSPYRGTGNTISSMGPSPATPSGRSYRHNPYRTSGMSTGMGM